MSTPKSSFTDKIIKFGQLIQTIKSLLPTPAPEYIEPQIQETGPMEGLASGAELKRYTYNDGKSFYLGNIHPDHKVKPFECGINDDRHIFIVAGNAAGKGRSLIVQNALRWKGGFVALDPKGELASITAMRRGSVKKSKGTMTSVTKFLGQKVAVLDPFNEVEGPARAYRARYNPLADIDIRSKEAHGQITRIAAGCIVPEEGSNAHFSDNAETILCGAIETVLFTYPKEKQNLLEVRKLLLRPFEDQIAIYQGKNPEYPHTCHHVPKDRLAAESLSVLDKLLDTDEAGSFNSTLSRNLKWLSEPIIKDHIERSDFSLSEIVKTGGSVYIVTPPDKIDELKCWIRIIIQTAISAKISLGINQTTQQTLFMLDEFPLLGRFKVIEQSAGFLRGYSCKLVCAIQNIGQVKNLYAKNWETFLGNAGAIIGFSTNDYDTEDYLSKRSGKIMAWEHSFSKNSGISNQAIGGVGNTGQTISESKKERAVRLPNEIHEQGARDTMRAFVIPADGKMFTVLRQNYDDIKTSGVFDSPKFCVAWEQKYGKHL